MSRDITTVTTTRREDKTLIPFVKMGVEAREQTVPWSREGCRNPRFHVFVFFFQQKVAGDVEEIDSFGVGV